MSGAVELVVRFASGEADLRLLSEDLAVASVTAQIREAKGWPASAHLRLIVGGHCLREDDYVAGSPGGGPTFLHVVKTDFAPAGRSGDTGAHADWLDSVDASSALGWICGIVLTCGWLWYYKFAGNDSQQAFTMLVGMTAVVCMGCCWRWVAPVLEAALMWWARYMECTPCYSGMDGLYGGVSRMRGGIPPRPAAPVVAPRSYS